jgi:hypothetical protein
LAALRLSSFPVARAGVVPIFGKMGSLMMVPVGVTL